MERTEPARVGRMLRCGVAAQAALLLLCGCGSGADPGVQAHDHAAADPANVPKGPPASAPAATSFTLTDIDGSSHGSLEHPEAGRWTALFFVRTDCPVSNQYAPEIRRICSAYAPQGLQCLLVYADGHDDVAAVRQHREDFGYSLPAIRDPGHSLVAQAGATITPEVAVFAAGASMAYRGRIDNLYTELGRPRQQVTERDLRDALDDLVAGREVRKARTQATGCYIE